MSVTNDLELAEATTRTAACQAMRERGLNNAEELLAFADVPSILRACRWFDGRPSSTTPGALAKLIREGGLPAQRARRSLTEQQAEYARQVQTWLRAHFPDLCDPTWGPHPAAIAEVTRLHWRHGRGALTKREHGPEIRRAIKAWEDKWGPGE